MLNIDRQQDWKKTLDAVQVSRLRSVHHRFNKGNPTEVTSEVWGSLSDEELVSVHSELTADVDDEVLLKSEASNIEKLSVRSVIVPGAQRLEGIKRHFEHIDQSLEEVERDFFRGRENENISQELFKPTDGGNIAWRRGRPLDLGDAVAHLPRDTNSGLPWLVRKSEIADRLDLLTSVDPYRYPCMPFSRSKSLTESRLVWGTDFRTVAEESRYYQPLLTGWERHLGFRAVLHGTDVLDSVMTRNLNYLPSGYVWMSADFSAYDASLSPSLMAEAVGVASNLFGSTEVDNLLMISYNLGTVGLAMPDGTWSGSHGMPSGSAFTNMVDSIVQYLAIRRVNERAGKTVVRILQIQGDDGVYVVEAGYEGQVVDTYRDMGISLNQEKSMVSDSHCTYLQRIYTDSFRKRSNQEEWGGVYPIGRALVRLKYPERFTNFKRTNMNGKAFWALRTLSILGNCVNHPGFEKLCRLANDLDPHLFSWTQEDLSSYSKMVERKIKAGAVNEGIQQWRLIRDIVQR